MDIKIKDSSKSEPTASPAPKDNTSQSESNLKSGKDSCEKLPQPLKSDEDEELLLCINSDNEPQKISDDTTDANPKGKNSEKYFSDIESSDNSQEYEVESKLKKEEKIGASASEETKKVEGLRSEEKCMEPSKTNELELEPVESDEEEFDENLLAKKTGETTDQKAEKEPSIEEALKDLEDISDKEDAQLLGETTSMEVDSENIEDTLRSIGDVLEKDSKEVNTSGPSKSDIESIEIGEGSVHVGEGNEQVAEKPLPPPESDLESCQLKADDVEVAISPRLDTEKKDETLIASVVEEDKCGKTEIKENSNTALDSGGKIVDVAGTIPDKSKKISGELIEIGEKGGEEQSDDSVKKTEEEISMDPKAFPEIKSTRHTSDEQINKIQTRCLTETLSISPKEEQISKESKSTSEKGTTHSKNAGTVADSSSQSEKLPLAKGKEEVMDKKETRYEGDPEEDKALTTSDKITEAASMESEGKQEEETVESERESKEESIQCLKLTNNKNLEEMEQDKSTCASPTEKELPHTFGETKKSQQQIVSPENTPAEQKEKINTSSDVDNSPFTEDNSTDKVPTDDNWNLREKLTTKVSELLKTIDSTSQQGLTSDDDESLLVIDTTHKDDHENEENDMETEAAATDSSSDGSLEIFYHKECSNYDCNHQSKNFYRAPQFALSYYKVSKKQHKPQFVCEYCYDQALHAYEEMCVILKQKQPLYGANFKRQDFVEIIDSSDEEDTESNTDNCKDDKTFPKESIEFLENELEGIIRNVMQSVDIQNQLSWTKQVLQQSIDRVREESSYVSDQLQQLQKKADKMHNSLYQCPSIKIRQLTPLDLNSGRSYSPESEMTIPAVGDIERPSIQLNETYYAVKNKAIASWVPCKVVEEADDGSSLTKNLKHYKIKFLKSKYPMLKTLSAKHMAYFDPPKVRLPIGTRVIAYFDASSLSRGKEKMLIPSAFYPGIIAEPLKMSNKFRYLVFYDDGYFQYVSYKDVRLVCHASENVWDDVHHQSRDFIQNYLTQYAVNRPMVQTQKGQCMLVDYNGKWVYARVVDVDCSLVQMMFEGQSRSEWIYRGSTRLGPVYKESNNIAPKTSWNQSRISRRTEPFIRYLNDEDSSSQSHSQPQQNASKSGEVRSVAKKSVSRADAATNPQPVPVVKHLNNSTIFVDDDNKPKGKVVYYTARKNLPPRDFVPHTCGPSCPFVITHNLQFYSPLAKPLLSGWERQVFRQKSKKFIVYRAPCGKRLRSMEELHRYLRVTNNELNVDNFDFSSETNCLAEYVIESCIVQKKDISNGEEKMPIPCVNYYDNTMPPDCKYSSRRIPTEGVHLNLDPDFLVGCDCDDDCSDKSKCSCWQLTYAGAKYSMPNVPHEMVGYQHKRLYAHVPTGIYECNSRCKCKANCVNRVVQQPLQSKLQVFKTSNRGWGLRCINDVPRGSFICIYAGHLLTEQKANEGGLDAGDEYFAELDYIEVAEQIKEGYESDVAEPDEEEEMYNPDKDDDDDEFIAPGDLYRSKSISTRLSTRRSTKNSSDAEHDSQERQVISFEPNKSQERPDSADEKPTMRRLFGKDEGTYIMDAKITGNLGRYFNHSCSPNLFVQNVFVDTHDLRFPWVAFFAFSHIRAGTELTWNYNYEVGVVPGKVLYCQCGAPNCRQRLL